MTRPVYCLSYVRHIDGLRHQLNNRLAPRYVDIIEDNKIRMVDRTKAARLQALKVYFTHYRLRLYTDPFLPLLSFPHSLVTAKRLARKSVSILCRVGLQWTCCAML